MASLVVNGLTYTALGFEIVTIALLKWLIILSQKPCNEITVITITAGASRGTFNNSQISYIASYIHAEYNTVKFGISQ